MNMWKHMLVNTVKKNYEYQKRTAYFGVFLFLTVIVTGLYVGILHNQTLPFAEGWYTYYAQCINQGLTPYKDFEYLYSPIYIYMIAFITKLFGYDLIILRRLGIIFFCGISISLYLVISILFDKKKNWIAFISAVTSAFYLQSEVVQVFYDYVRLMDIFAILSVYFLLRTVKKISESKKEKFDLIFCGIFCSLFINIKQNMGLIFSAYAFVLLLYIYIYYKVSVKKIVKNFLLFFAPIIVSTIILYSMLFFSGALHNYLASTGTGAISAKGGMIAILFGWITNNWGSFTSVFKQALLIIAIMFLLIYISKKTNSINLSTNIEEWIGILFFFVTFALIFAITFDQSFALKVFNNRSLSPYLVFLIVFPFFVVLGIIGIYDMVVQKEYLKKYLLFFVLVGSYFAISFGCGNSGGLAEGQASLGIAFIVAFFLYFLSYRLEKILRIAFMFVCVSLVIQCADKKMIYTYNWWGMDESTYWDSRAISDISLLNGIGMSVETKDVYEQIYKIIEDNTSADDPIFCFPQIPIFYSLCNRNDPGTTTKVQWFDVATDESVESDISVIESNPPAAIIIYNTSEYAYNAHESSFRKGQVSGTRKMREFLYNYVYENGYSFAGRYCANNNTLQIWIKETLTPHSVFSGGTGTIEDPYLIENAEQLFMFSKMVNDGRSFEGEYIKQITDIDLADYPWIPIGEFDCGAYFYGTYDGAGHIIKNIHLSSNILSSNVGLFGQLGGSVYNLGVEDSLLEGSCVGTIASHSIGENAHIINCYSNINVSAYRAGGIADNFSGEISNCFSVGEISGVRSANVVSYGFNSRLNNVFIPRSVIKSKMDSLDMYNNNIIYCDDELFASGLLCDELNNYANVYNSSHKDSTVLHEWVFTNNMYPTLK